MAATRSKTVFFEAEIACGWFHPFYVSLHTLSRPTGISAGWWTYWAHRVQTFTVIIWSLLCFTLRIKLRDKRARTWFRSKLWEERREWMDWNEIEDRVGMLRSRCLAKKLFWTRRFDPFLFVELAGICISFSFFFIRIVSLKLFRFNPIKKF